MSPALTSVAVAHADFTDHAAGRVLYLLDVGIDDHRSGRDQRAGDRHRRGPAAEAAGQHQDDDKAYDQMQPDRAARAAHFVLHVLTSHDLPPASETILIGGGGPGTRCSTCPSTCSFGPNACMRPSFSTRSWSTASMPIGRCATTTTMAPRSRAARTARVSASSPSLSRLELGSSSTIRKGLPYSARASATRCAWPADSAVPCSPIWVS